MSGASLTLVAAPGSALQVLSQASELASQRLVASQLGGQQVGVVVDEEGTVGSASNLLATGEHLQAGQLLRLVRDLVARIRRHPLWLGSKGPASG